MPGPTADRIDVSRLFARVAFGARGADLDAWTGKPYADLVDHLLDVPDPLLRPPLPDEPRRIALEAGGRATAQLGDPPLALALAQRWWLERMRTTPCPVEERMVLFWHDHFATGPGGPFPDPSMQVHQNQTLRRNALGSFRRMCEEITVDPAMLYWLNGSQSTRGKPNENYAREFFELFTLGTIPQVYDDTAVPPYPPGVYNDVRESARALTGWTVDLALRTPVFTPNRHDTGTKVVLGRTIPNLAEREYLEIVDIALAQPVASRFVAYKLVLNFGYLPRTTNLLADPDPLVERVAAVLRGGWDLKATVRAMLLDDDFRYSDPTQQRQIVRQPIDLVVGACRALNVTADSEAVLQVLRRMGQEPFEPPNVAGWPFGRNWISLVTMIARYDWGKASNDLWRAASPLTRAALPPSNDLTGWARLLGIAVSSATQSGLSANTERVLVDHTQTAPGTEADKQAGVFMLLASSPDWMVV